MALHVVLTYLSSINGADVFKYLPHAVAAMTLNIFNNITSTHHTFYSLKPSSLNNAAVLDGTTSLLLEHTHAHKEHSWCGGEGVVAPQNGLLIFYTRSTRLSFFYL